MIYLIVILWCIYDVFEILQLSRETFWNLIGTANYKYKARQDWELITMQEFDFAYLFWPHLCLQCMIWSNSSPEIMSGSYLSYAHSNYFFSMHFIWTVAIKMVTKRGLFLVLGANYTIEASAQFILTPQLTA